MSVLQEYVHKLQVCLQNSCIMQTRENNTVESVLSDRSLRSLGITSGGQVSQNTRLAETLGAVDAQRQLNFDYRNLLKLTS